jgi:hypothetical protein
MVAILLTMGKEAELPVCAYSWFLQKGRLVGLAYCSRIELSARVLLHKRLFFFLSCLLCYVSSLHPVIGHKSPLREQT